MCIFYFYFFNPGIANGTSTDMFAKMGSKATGLCYFWVPGIESLETPGLDSNNHTLTLVYLPWPQ